MHELEREMASIEARVSVIERNQGEIKADLKAIRSKTDRWTGQVALVALAIPAAIAAGVAWLLSKLS